jgi:hypothetical protein
MVSLFTFYCTHTHRRRRCFVKTVTSQPGCSCMFIKIIALSAALTAAFISATTTRTVAQEGFLETAEVTQQEVDLPTNTLQTSGAWAYEHYKSCNDASSSEPFYVMGMNLGVCIVDSQTGSMMYTGCVMSADMTTMTYYRNTYATSDTHCSGLFTTSSDSFFNLEGGCAAGRRWLCGAAVTVRSYWRSQHIGHYSR